VRAAYHSGNPALGVGPGNVPVLVDATADLARAASSLVDSKSFDNSILCTNESTLIAERAIADELVAELRSHGGHVLDPGDTDRVREACYPDGVINTSLAGKDAAALAQAAGIRIPTGTRVLVAPFELIAPEEPLAREKLFPLLGMVRVPAARRGIAAACALLRIGGAGHSAVIHSQSPSTVLAYGAAVRVLRVAVNAPGSTGSAGLDTFLAPTMTIGTGFFGRSSLTENLQPRDLVQWTQVAYSNDPAVPFGAFAGLEPWSASAPVQAPPPLARSPQPADGGLSRDELRRLILEELREVVRS
jgi:acyl-CoA reductase-like NAD-dependent aldehyde dehydrogenase